MISELRWSTKQLKGQHPGVRAIGGISFASLMKVDRTHSCSLENLYSAFG